MGEDYRRKYLQASNHCNNSQHPALVVWLNEARHSCFSLGGREGSVVDPSMLFAMLKLFDTPSGSFWNCILKIKRHIQLEAAGWHPGQSPAIYHCQFLYHESALPFIFAFIVQPQFVYWVLQVFLCFPNLAFYQLFMLFLFFNFTLPMIVLLLEQNKRPDSISFRNYSTEHQFL